jgi:hypothetical protein
MKRLFTSRLHLMRSIGRGRAIMIGCRQSEIKMTRSTLLALLCSSVLLLTATARADDRDKRLDLLFDKPVATKTIPAKSDAKEGSELRCTYFADFMIRETGTDTPAPGPATLLAVTGGGRPACNAARIPHGVPLATENYSLLGRKSSFILFSATDPNGAIPFMVLNAVTGKVIYADAMIEDQMSEVSVESGVLRLRFKRGINGSCSLPAGGDVCWAKLAGDAKIPAEVPRPDKSLCVTTYGENKAPADDPSIVSYDVEVTLSVTGNARIVPRGMAGCLPMP